MEKKKQTVTILLWGAVAALCLGSILLILQRSMSPEERALRKSVIAVAQGYLGCNESDGTHRAIIDLYNEQAYLPRGYEMTYEDSWCAAFVSVVTRQTNMAEWISPECSCEEMIGLLDGSGDWEESDWYMPQPGDLIFYDWDGRWIRDNKGWSDHVGIVVSVYGPVIKVIEGNYEDAVGYHYVFVNHPHIRGYGLPDYRKCAAAQ